MKSDRGDVAVTLNEGAELLFYFGPIVLTPTTTNNSLQKPIVELQVSAHISSVPSSTASSLIALFIHSQSARNIATSSAFLHAYICHDSISTSTCTPQFPLHSVATYTRPYDKMALASQTAKRSDSFPLFDLCPELQNMIFDLAYPAEDTDYLIFTSEWEYKEVERRREDPVNFLARPFPKRKVDDWLVSKRYLHLAASAWFGNQDFDGEIAGSKFLSRSNGLFLEYAKRIDMLPAYLLSKIPDCNRLTSLTVRLRYTELDQGGLEGKLGDADVFERSDLASLRVTPQLTAITSLRHFNLYAVSWGLELPTELLKSNVATPEGLVKPGMLMRKETQSPSEHTAGACVSLYKHSKVCAVCPKLDCLSELDLAWQRIRGMVAGWQDASLSTAEELTTADIPTTAEDVVKLMSARPAALATWITWAKMAVNCDDD